MEKPDVRDAVTRIRELPTLPSVLGQILTIVADPDASALDLGRHITADQSLSATILKLVNSAYYGFYRQIKSVTMAIVILGFVEVRNLVLAATTFRILADSPSRFDRTQLWRHSVWTSWLGAGKSGSPNAPTPTATSSGIRAGCQNTVEPQVPQKWNCTSYPASEGRV